VTLTMENQVTREVSALGNISGPRHIDRTFGWSSSEHKNGLTTLSSLWSILFHAQLKHTYVQAKEA
jgi:hypothetical protein